MVELFDEITGFEWDKGNERKSVAKHGVTAAETEQAFLNKPLVVADDVKHSRIEPRFHALGHTDEGRLLHITFTIRGSKIRVISARDMHRKERTIYEQAT
ncbi:MAG: BrnT family toxin [Pseudomonadota bacterium]